MSEKLGASEKYLPIDLTATVPPLTFESAFRAAYPNTGRREFVSRCIVAVDGPGTLTLVDPEGDEVEWPMQAYEANEVRATGIAAASGITTVKVFL